MSRRAAVAIVLWIAASTVLGSCAGDGHTVTSIRFAGTQYHARQTIAVNVPEASLREIGDASDVNAPVTGRTVYALAGVDPADVVVMRGDPALSAGAFVVFVDPARPTASIADVPGMCTYIVAPAC
ncbi:MAG: hypothetical protein H0W07_03930 [Chloroflexi bacterium]|nr:hypothetical protein [Chloroflexota bacterium]